MGQYYNKTRGPLPLSLQSGKSMMVPAKGWVTIEPADEGSPDVIAFKKRGDLVPAKVQPSSEPPLPPPAAPMVVEEPVLSSMMEVEALELPQADKVENEQAMEAPSSDEKSDSKSSRFLRKDKR